MFSPINLRIESRVAYITFRRMEAANAFTTEMLSQFLQAMAEAQHQADVLLIASAGRDFSVGRDRSEPKRAPFEAFKLITEVNESLDRFAGIAISAVSGRAFGFALGIVMRSDIVLTADDARFALDEVKLGIPPMFIMAEILEHLAPKVALDIVLSSREFSAQEALTMGLVSQVVPNETLESVTAATLEELRSRNPAVLRASKRYMREVRQLPAAARSAYALVEQTRFALATH